MYSDDFNHSKTLTTITFTIMLFCICLGSRRGNKPGPDVFVEDEHLEKFKTRIKKITDDAVKLKHEKRKLRRGQKNFFKLVDIIFK